jgi:NAD(P)-dependent dehydrogenase (short-subunit alcohol dehydrogenase family)
MRFEGKAALVTGAGSGIGLATARRLAAEGASVVAAIFEESQRPALGDLEGIVLDVSDEAAWDAAMTHMSEAHGGLDVLVNNAGVTRMATAEETDWELWDHVIAVNLEGTFLGCKKAIPLLRRRGGGAIVNVASINGIRGNTRLVAYAASKGGVVAMTMSLALDHIAENIRINCVCPATIDTGMVRDMLDEADDRALALQTLIAKHPIGRIAEPEEVAAVIAHLASSDASFQTGLAIPVDGGRTVR